MSACRFAVQYEDGDREEFVRSELLKKKNMLQPAGVEQRTDFEELDRLYDQAQAEWAAGTGNPANCSAGSEKIECYHLICGGSYILLHLKRFC